VRGFPEAVYDRMEAVYDRIFLFVCGEFVMGKKYE
jgi:hypothetical protein